MTTIDTSKWSGEGTFTHVLVERLKTLDAIALIRVEDAPATRSDADYNFISNEIFIGFATEPQREAFKRFGFLPASRTAFAKRMTMTGLEQALNAMDDVGAPDYSDDGMLQYLRTERIVPPYQTKGYKLVELVRIYEADATRVS
jgi:hypothetical protein